MNTFREAQDALAGYDDAPAPGGGRNWQHEPGTRTIMHTERHLLISFWAAVPAIVAQQEQKSTLAGILTEHALRIANTLEWDVSQVLLMDEHMRFDRVEDWLLFSRDAAFADLGSFPEQAIWFMEALLPLMRFCERIDHPGARQADKESFSVMPRMPGMLRTLVYGALKLGETERYDSIPAFLKPFADRLVSLWQRQSVARG